MFNLVSLEMEALHTFLSKQEMKRKEKKKMDMIEIVLQTFLKINRSVHFFFSYVC